MTMVRVVSVLGLALFAPAAAAQYPAKPVKIIVPFAAGGVSDIVARVVAQKMTEQSGKSFIVENRTGAGGRIGYEAAAKSAGDGYTLAATDTTYTMLPALYTSLPWDPAQDLVPVTLLAPMPFVLVVSAKAKETTLGQLLAQARANPGKINYGSAGMGSVNHVVTELFQRAAKIQLTHVPYKGMGDAMTGLLSGSVDVLVTAMPTAMSNVKSGRILPLAVTSAKRASALPEVPTAVEAGVADFVAANWVGFTAPKGTPQEAIDWLAQHAVAAVATPEARERLATLGAEPAANGPADFGRLMRADGQRWAEVIRAAGIKPE
ncbi:MAG TPA: tripartite tricarboxylate transporter substrate binding protein [Burkholderiales bacterium]|jgi:tripartite-type tricarboxylate transporter receptor subunit TctC|nr:tripartite tricarboxylate transporter substrate binding protein [Burkholderiales bacterium]